MSGFNTNPDHLRRSGSMLSRFGQTVANAGEKLDDTGQNLVEHANGDRSGIGAVVAKGMGRGVSVLGKVFKQGGRVADKAGQNLGKTGDLHEEADNHARDGLLKVHPDDKTKHLPGGSTRTASAVSAGGKESDPKKLPGGGERSGSEVGEGGSGRTDKAPPKVDGEDHRSGDLFGRSKPPSATTPVDEPVRLPQSHSPGLKPDGADDGTPHTTPTGPADKRRGAVLEQIDPTSDRVTTKNGLIETVDGKPVKQYVQELSAQRAHDIAPGVHPKKDGPCSAAAIDLRTGLITEGVNGRANEQIPLDELHPTLQENYKNMADWKHEAVDENGNVVASLDGKAHFDQPLRHAEVKAVNEQLWERERQGLPTDRSALDELRIDPRFLVDKGDNMRVGGEAGACANCYNILDGVPSYTGRFPYHPQDHRYSRIDVADR